MTRNQFCVRLLIGCVLLSTYDAALAIRSDWTAQEIACAATIGVDLTTGADPGSPVFERHLAWISEHVVFGHVREIRHDIRGQYPTIVELEVVSTLKGPHSAGDTVYIALFSGPIYYPPDDVMVETRQVGEPTFSKGEDVLLFLTPDTYYDRHDPDRFALPENHYRPVDHVKWVIESGQATLVGNGGHTHTVGWIDGEIDLAVTTQNAGCQ